MKNDDFGDRMKFYEQAEAGRMLMPLLPICARLDGRGFSKFTKGLKRPFDDGMTRAMVLTTMYLVEETNARVGYTQSDEISLIYYSDTYESQVFFNGKTQKMVSVLASMATAKFNSLISSYLPTKIEELPVFDCRVWNVPNEVEAANTILWREKDATKNSISMAAQAHYSHKELDGKSSSEKIEMLFQKGVKWEAFPDYFKRGTFIQRRKYLVVLSDEERIRIPLAHRPAVNEKVERSRVIELHVPPFSRVINRADVVFRGAEPETDSIKVPLADVP